MIRRLGTGKPRYLTITFDDGLIDGTRKAVRILDAFGVKATFYVVTGWIRPKYVLWTRDNFNKQRDHGTWNDWRRIAGHGHEIGSHTVSHINASGKVARALPCWLRWEIKKSYRDIERRIGRAPRSISMPQNAATVRSDSYVRSNYAACRLGSSAARCNDFEGLDWYRLHSWAPNSDVSIRTICETIADVPPNHWLILQFHSLDDEGYMPISSESFTALLEFIEQEPDLEVRTVSDMVDLHKYGRPSGRTDAIKTP